MLGINLSSGLSMFNPEPGVVGTIGVHTELPATATAAEAELRTT